SDAVESAMENYDAFPDAVVRGDGRTAIRLYDGFPKSLQDLKSTQSLRLQAAAFLPEGPQRDAILADVERRFPNDASLDLIWMDFYGEDPEKLVEILERLDRAVDGDPFLRGLMAEYLPDVGRPEDAMTFARQAVDEEPDLPQAQYGLLSAQIGVGDFTGAMETLDRLENDFGVFFTDTELIDYYPRGEEFIASAAYRDGGAAPPR
ncbi:MAG: tetratricopeptide repeat protein, partial [Planctomycetota bacterium]